MIVETAVLARLLGVKLLTLEGTVVLTPAQILPTTAAVTPRTRREVGARRGDGGQVVGRRLPAAARLLRDASEELRDGAR